MAIAFRVFADAGIVALFEEAAGGGDVFDIDAPRNAPAKEPESHLDKIKLHTLLDNLEVYLDTTTTISHGAGSGAGSNGYGNANLAWNLNRADRLLATHSLGYEPLVLVAQGDNVLWPGMPVQVNTIGGGRYMVPYVTTTEVRAQEWLSAGSSGLSAVSIDYRVLVFRQPRDASGSKLWDFDPDTGILKLGLDRFSSDRAYLQVVPGGSPFGVFSGRNGDLKNGAPRMLLPDGTVFDAVPSTITARVDGKSSYGSSMGYTGSFTGAPVFQVQAP